MTATAFSLVGSGINGKVYRFKFEQEYYALKLIETETAYKRERQCVAHALTNKRRSNNLSLLDEDKQQELLRATAHFKPDKKLRLVYKSCQESWNMECVPPGILDRFYVEIAVALVSGMMNAMRSLEPFQPMDVKPDNVLLCKTNNAFRIMLIDFGGCNTATERVSYYDCIEEPHIFSSSRVYPILSIRPNRKVLGLYKVFRTFKSVLGFAPFDATKLFQRQGILKKYYRRDKIFNLMCDCISRQLELQMIDLCHHSARRLPSFADLKAEDAFLRCMEEAIGADGDGRIRKRVLDSINFHSDQQTLSGGRRKAVEPAAEAWMSKEDAGFRSFVRRLLEDEKADGDGKAGAVFLQKHQLAVRKFLLGSPYRGLLAFHGLGSGKTCAAISAAEALAAKRPRVFVVLPASLQGNFQKEVAKCGKDLGVDAGQVHFVRMNGVTVTKAKDSQRGVNPSEMTIDGLSVHGSVIVIDEVHNLAGYKRNGGKRGEALYHVIHNARDAKVICLSGTIIVNDPFELAVILNMISGPQRSLVFRTPRLKSDAIRDALDADPRVADHVLDGTSIVVRPVPEGYERKSASSQLLVRSSVDLGRKPHHDLKADVKAAIGASSARLNEETVFPEDESDFDRRFVDESSGSIANRTMFQLAAMGSVSHFQLTRAEARSKGFPDVLPERRVVLDMTSSMFERYSEQRAVEIAMEKSSARRAKRTGDDEQGNFRSGTRMLCNFAFEKKGVRPFLAGLRRGDPEAPPDEDDQAVPKAQSAYDRKLRDALGKLRESNYAALKGERLREQSPKMAAILDELGKAGGPALVYSNFRAMEGVGIFGLALEAAGYTRLKMDGDRVSADTRASGGVFHEFAGASENPAALDVFNGNDKAWNRRRGKRPPVDVILVTGAGAEGISLKGVRQVHIMEPFWNEVRVQQVIGRAARLGSHGHLPEAQRNVTVYRYVMRFAEGAQRRDQQLRRHDKNRTTDEYVDALSARKASLAESFLSALKAVAVDCGMYPESVTCFGEARDDGKKRRKLRVVEENGVMLIVDDVAGRRYSFDAYKRDKKLVEVEAS